MKPTLKEFVEALKEFLDFMEEQENEPVQELN